MSAPESYPTNQYTILTYPLSSIVDTGAGAIHRIGKVVQSPYTGYGAPSTPVNLLRNEPIFAGVYSPADPIYLSNNLGDVLGHRIIYHPVPTSAESGLFPNPEQELETTYINKHSSTTGKINISRPTYAKKSNLLLFGGIAIAGLLLVYLLHKRHKKLKLGKLI